VVTVAVPDANWAAVDPVRHTVFVSSRDTDSVYYLSAPDLSIQGVIGVGQLPFGLGANPANRLLYVANYGSGSVSIINMDTLSVVVKHLTGGGPTFVAVDAAAGLAYVPLHPTNRVARFSGTIYLGAFSTRGDQVFSVALDDQASPKRLYVGRRGRYSDVEVYNADVQPPAYLTTLTPGGEVYNLAVEGGTGNLYVMHTGADGASARFMTVYDRHGTRLTAAPVDIGADTSDGGGLGFEESSGRIYVAGTGCLAGTTLECSGYAADSAVVILRGMPPAVVARLQETIPRGPFGVAVDQSLHTVYITSKGSGGWVAAIDDRSLAVHP